MHQRKELIYDYKYYTTLYLSEPLTRKRVELLNIRPIYTTYNDPDSPTRSETITYYKYRFPILFWERKDGSQIPTLFCELTINSYDWKIIVDVRKPNGDTYAYFYCTEITSTNKLYHPMLINIHKTIRKELNNLGVVSKVETTPIHKEGENDNNGLDNTSRKRSQFVDKRGNKTIKKKKGRNTSGTENK